MAETGGGEAVVALGRGRFTVGKRDADVGKGSLCNMIVMCQKLISARLPISGNC